MIFTRIIWLMKDTSNFIRLKDVKINKQTQFSGSRNRRLKDQKYKIILDLLKKMLQESML